MPSVLSLIFVELAHVLFAVATIFSAIPAVFPLVKFTFAAVPAIFEAIKPATCMPSFITIQFAIIVAIETFELYFDKPDKIVNDMYNKHLKTEGCQWQI